MRRVNFLHRNLRQLFLDSFNIHISVVCANHHFDIPTSQKYSCPFLKIECIQITHLTVHIFLVLIDVLTEPNVIAFLLLRQCIIIKFGAFAHQQIISLFPKIISHHLCQLKSHHFHNIHIINGYPSWCQ